jgi:hypothetical protein
VHGGRQDGPGQRGPLGEGRWHAAGGTGPGVAPFRAPDPWDPPPGLDRPGRHRTRRVVLISLAGVVVLALIAGVAGYALSGSRGCGHDTIALNVVASPEIAPAITDIGRSFNDQHHSIDGRCVKADVRAADSSEVARTLSGAISAPGTARPDIWIPDSSLWLASAHLSRPDAAGGQLTPVSVAQTPVVAATTRPLATAIAARGGSPTWKALLKRAAGPASGTGAGSVRLRILDPAGQAAGIGAVVMTQNLLRGDPDALQTFSRLVQEVRRSVSPTTQALLAGLSQGPPDQAPLVIVPEQAVWKYDHENPPVPATAIYPSDGVSSLDYPFTAVTADGAKVNAAGMLAQAMRTPKAHAAVQALGFRSPDGRTAAGFAANGLTAGVPRALPAPSAGDVTEAMRTWSKLSLLARALCLLDVSGSMAQPVGGGTSRLRATAKIGAAALGTLPDDTDVGLWTFSTRLDGSSDYRVNVPIGPLAAKVGSASRREAMLKVLGGVRPKMDGDTGLYDSVLAAVRSLRKTYKQGYYNNVLLLTDGKNDDPSGLTLTRLLRTLRKENDPNRPVPVLSIGFGPDVDLKPMQRIAEETNGAAYHAMSPADVQRILQEIIAQRICSTRECH